MKPLKLTLEPGRYVVAVSGGVDSVALLHLLAQMESPVTSHQSPVGLPRDSRLATSDYTFVVAHFDHGIREDSDLDQQLVAEHARRLGLPYVFDRGNLGAGTSEAAARTARYNFLRRVQQATGAHALVTAHHQDDLLETAILNILRGTGRKGLSSLRDRHDLRRPLLHIPKTDLKAYARDQGLVWHEDSTNTNTALTRNYVRHVLLPKLSEVDKKQLLAYVRHVGVLNQAIDHELATLLHVQPSKHSIDRKSFIGLPHAVSKELLAEWLRENGYRNFNAKALERLVIAIKTGRPQTFHDINDVFRLKINKTDAQLIKR